MNIHSYIIHCHLRGLDNIPRLIIILANFKHNTKKHLTSCVSIAKKKKKLLFPMTLSGPRGKKELFCCLLYY